MEWLFPTSEPPQFNSRQELFIHCLRSVNPALNGYYAEFGVASGVSINFLADHVPHQIHGFDSFAGLPEDWRPEYRKGAFAEMTLPVVKRNVILHPGWFHDVLPAWAENNRGAMAFIHMDADLYSSTKTVLDILAGHIMPGTIIQFDEFFNYPGWEDHEYRALCQFAVRHNMQFEYIGRTVGGNAQQVAIRVLSFGDVRRGGDMRMQPVDEETLLKNIVDRRFLYVRADDLRIFGQLQLNEDRSIGIYSHDNERSWSIRDGRLCLLDSAGKVTTSYQPLAEDYSIFFGWWLTPPHVPGHMLWRL